MAIKISTSIDSHRRTGTNYEIFNTSYLWNNTTFEGVNLPLTDFRFSYSGVEILVKGSSDISVYKQLVIIVDGVYQETVTVDSDYHAVSFSAGSKNIRIIEGVASKPSSTVLGTRIESVLINNSNTNAIITESSQAKKIVFIGDSIAIGDHSTTPGYQACSTLYKYDDDIEIGFIGYGYATTDDISGNATKTTNTVNAIADLFTNVTTTKYILLALGTNDYADSVSAADFLNNYGNLLDAINTADNTIDIYCLSPLFRFGETSLLDDYRTGIDGLCTARGYCTHIAGKNILTYPGDYFDTVHPTTAGHAKLKIALDVYL